MAMYDVWCKSVGSWSRNMCAHETVRLFVGFRHLSWQAYYKHPGSIRCALRRETCVIRVISALIPSGSKRRFRHAPPRRLVAYQQHGEVRSRKRQTTTASPSLLHHACLQLVLTTTPSASSSSLSETTGASQRWDIVSNPLLGTV